MPKLKSADVRCDRCTSVMIEITLTVSERPVTMRSCSQCDRRSWTADGEPLGLGVVLEQIGATRR